MKRIIAYFGVIVCCLFYVITNTNALNIDDVISKKEVTLKMVVPTNEDLRYTAYDLFNSMYPDYSFDNCDDDVTTCDIMKYGDKIATVTVKYDYDPVVKKVVDGILKKLGDNEHTFFLSDIESINYFYANRDYISKHPELDEDPSFDGLFALTFPSFSSDMKKYFGYNNFEVRVGLGSDGMYYQAQGGGIEFRHNGILYGIGPMTLVVNPFVVYISEGATDIEEAIKDRLGKYFSVSNVEKYTMETVSELLESEEEAFGNYWDSDVSTWPGTNGYNSKEEYVADMMDMEYLNENAPAHYLAIAEEYRYVVEFEDGWATILAVVRDNEKANDSRVVVTNDAGTGVEVKTEGVIPLDTLISVARITSGAEYDKIIKLLNTENVDMFDLKLFSTSENKYITKLDDGSFEVRLPIRDELKEKDLIVYYVDENDKIEKYEVKIEDGYAVFKTNHFSIYTLAVNDSTINPNTYDNIFTYLITFITSILCFVVLGTYLRKKLYN